MPSPVVLLSRQIRCPDDSPPRRHPNLCILSITKRSPTPARSNPMPSCLRATSIPKLVIKVPTTPFGRPLGFPTAMMKSNSSPSTISPFPSTMMRRSPSPSSAIPRSALCSSTASASTWGLVEPQSTLILMPSGSTPTAITSAPSSENTLGAM